MKKHQSVWPCAPTWILFEEVLYSPFAAPCLKSHSLTA